MLLGSRKVVLNHTLKTLSSLPAYCSDTLPSTSPTAELYRWRNWDSETQVCKRALNRTQILSLPFPKSVSNVNPALSRVMFLQCYFSWIFITSEVLCQYSIQRPCSTPEAHRMGQCFFLKIDPKTTPYWCCGFWWKIQIPGSQWGPVESESLSQSHWREHQHEQNWW